MRKNKQTNKKTCKCLTELIFITYDRQSKLYCYTVCWKYFAEKLIMLLTLFINMNVLVIAYWRKFHDTNQTTSESVKTCPS